MKRSNLVLAVVLASFGHGYAYGYGYAGRAAAGVEARVDSIFAPWNRTDSPGCALAVIRDGSIVYERGYGMADLEHGIAISPTSVFYVGSVSKQFVATSIALLAEEGKLSLDDDIRKYVPEIPDYGRPITIRNLIHHTSGLRDYLTLLDLSGRSFADSIVVEEVIDLIARQKELNFEPGEEHLYSNSGYFLLAVIVHRVSGQTLSEYAEERIFSPLGMGHSHFHDDPAMVVPNRAEGHLAEADGTWGLTRSRFALVGSGGLFTTVEDLYRWDQNFYENRLGRGGPSLLETLLTRGTLNDGEVLDYAFGLTLGEYRGLQTVRHGGALGGYRAHLLRFPSERFSVAIACNLDDIDPGPLADQVADAYLDDRFKEDRAKARPPVAGSERSEEPSGLPAERAELAAFAGEYESEELAVTYRLFMEEGDLFVQIRRNPKMLLRMPAPDVLYRDGVRLTFQRDDTSGISGFVLDAGRVRHLRFLKR